MMIGTGTKSSSSISRSGKSGFTNVTGEGLINSDDDDLKVFFRIAFLTEGDAGFGYCSVKLPYFMGLGDCEPLFLLLGLFTETLGSGEICCFSGEVGREDSADRMPSLRADALPDFVIN